MLERALACAPAACGCLNFFGQGSIKPTFFDMYREKPKTKYNEGERTATKTKDSQVDYRTIGRESDNHTREKTGRGPEGKVLRKDSYENKRQTRLQEIERQPQAKKDRTRTGRKSVQRRKGADECPLLQDHQPSDHATRIFHATQHCHSKLSQTKTATKQ